MGSSRAGSTSDPSPQSASDEGAEHFEWTTRDAASLELDAPQLAPFLEAIGPLAVVDLETTGLADDRRAEIIEVGVVTFDLVAADRGEVLVRTLAGLVCPRYPIPPAIQRITGLRDRDLEGAPPLASMASRIEAALEGRAIVAHNAEFERTFLSREVARPLGHAHYLDTQDLFAVTHPDASDLRLETFAAMLLDRVERHRALEDALDTARILAVIAAASHHSGASRYSTARRALDRYAPTSPWLALLGGRPLPEPAREELQFIAIEASEHPPVRFDEDAIAAVMADEERGRAYFPGYRVREEQIALAREFVRNLRDGGTLLLEGGTGVGKSLAYLAAAIPYLAERRARGERAPLVVSTRTKLLQDQLLRKDIAAAARFLGHSDVAALSIKGRANYACARRLDAVLAEGREVGLLPEERYAYAVLMACCETRPHSEIGRLPAALLRRYPQLPELRRRSVASRAEQCSRERCGKTPGCRFGARRAALAKADLIVANHDLLLRWPPDYPRFANVIVDEAHELVGVADEVYAEVVRPEDVIELFDEVFDEARDPDDAAPTSSKLPALMSPEARAMRGEIQMDLAGLGRLLARRASEYGEVQLFADPAKAFPEAAELAGVAAQRIENAARAGLRRGPESTDVDADAESPIERACADLRANALALRRAFSVSDDFVSDFGGLTPPYGRWRLSIRPVSPAEAFHREFMDDLESFAAVSASLFIAGDSFAALGELEIDDVGIEEIREVTVESPFPYQENMRVVALKPAPDLVRETAETIAVLATELGGRTLGLFTSLRRMHEVAQILDQRLADSGIEILAPRRAADDPAALVQRFASHRGGAVLLGARTFWQGLDLPGDGLQAVVIEKLPFEVPTELRRRREARVLDAGGDPFGRFTLGKMLLHLKQMNGRLIRTEEDRGVVVIVEGRTDKRYFRRIGTAFPPGTTVRVVRREALPGILAEVGLGRDPDAHDAHPVARHVSLDGLRDRGGGQSRRG